VRAAVPGASGARQLLLEAHHPAPDWQAEAGPDGRLEGGHCHAGALPRSHGTVLSCVLRRCVRFCGPWAAVPATRFCRWLPGFFVGRGSASHPTLPVANPQRACPLEPAFMWCASARLAPLVSLRGFDSLVEGHGRCQWHLWGSLPAAAGEGREVDQSLLVRWLAGELPGRWETQPREGSPAAAAERVAWVGFSHGRCPPPQLQLLVPTRSLPVACGPQMRPAFRRRCSPAGTFDGRRYRGAS
jgi:hypothetical protein